MRPRFALLYISIALVMPGGVVAQAAPSSGAVPQSPATPPPQAGRPLPPAITIEQAIALAKKNNPTLNANQMLIAQSKAQEITANLRPNPVLSWDLQYLPIFEPGLFGDSNYWETQAQYDVGIGYLARGREIRRACVDGTLARHGRLQDRKLDLRRVSRSSGRICPALGGTLS